MGSSTAPPVATLAASEYTNYQDGLTERCEADQGRRQQPRSRGRPRRQGPRPLLLLCPLVSSLQAVHSHAQGLLRGSGGNRDCFCFFRSLSRGHGLLYEGIPRRLAGHRAQPCCGKQPQAEIRSIWHPLPCCLQKGRNPRHKGRTCWSYQHASCPSSFILEEIDDFA